MKSNIQLVLAYFYVDICIGGVFGFDASKNTLPPESYDEIFVMAVSI